MLLKVIGALLVVVIMLLSGPMVRIHELYQERDAERAVAAYNLGEPRHYNDLSPGHYKVVMVLPGEHVAVVTPLTPHGDVYKLVDNIPAAIGLSGMPFRIPEKTG